MKTIKVQLALLGSLLSMFAHLYLTFHYYPLRLGFASGSSLCSLNPKLDCDAVSVSAYSDLFGPPLSVWGLMVNLALAVLTLQILLQWKSQPERLKRWTVLLAGMSLIASLVMATISFTLLQTYCIVCFTLYFLSAAIFFLLRGTLGEPWWPNILKDLPQLRREAMGILLTFLLIPTLTFAVHQTSMHYLAGAKVDPMVRESVEQWQRAPVQDFVAPPLLVMGPARDKAVMTLAEFADFHCGHCKHASYSLHAFVKSYPDVRFEFYTFPLDHECNEAFPSTNGISCRMADAVYCAELSGGKGWALHDFVFNSQDEISHHDNPAERDAILEKAVNTLGLNWVQMQTCMADSGTQKAIRDQANQGSRLGVQATPTLFVNTRQLKNGQMIPVLQAVRATFQKKGLFTTESDYGFTEFLGLRLGETEPDFTKLMSDNGFIFMQSDIVRQKMTNHEEMPKRFCIVSANAMGLNGYTSISCPDDSEDRMVDLTEASFFNNALIFATFHFWPVKGSKAFSRASGKFGGKFATAGAATGHDVDHPAEVRVCRDKPCSKIMWQDQSSKAIGVVSDWDGSQGQLVDLSIVDMPHASEWLNIVGHEVDSQNRNFGAQYGL